MSRKKILSKEKYPDDIMEDLRQRRGLEEDDESEDNDIMQMSKSDVLDEVVTWNNLIHYGEPIKQWINDIYDIDLDEYDENKEED